MASSPTVAVPRLKPHDLRVLSPSPAWLCAHFKEGWKCVLPHLGGTLVGQERHPAVHSPGIGF